MAKNRYINTKIWRDPYFEKLNPEAKLLFLYLITNEALDLCGIFELSKRRISIETGIPLKGLERLCKALENDGKVYFIDNWVVVTNFMKHQTPNSNVLKGMQRSLDEIPAKISQKMKGFERLWKALKGYSTLLNLTLPNLSDTSFSKKTTGNTKSMYEEPTIELDEHGEELLPKPKHSGTYGKYTRVVAQHYADIHNKVVTGQTMGEAKKLLAFLHEQYPDDSNASLSTEAKAAIDLTHKFYEQKEIKDWGLLKAIENFKKL